MTDHTKPMPCPVCERAYDNEGLEAALAFYDKVEAAPRADQAAVGTDAIDWLLREARKLCKSPVPVFSIGTDELAALPLVNKGDMVPCKHCDKEHPLECGTEGGVESDLLMFYKCGGQSYIAAVDRRLI